MDGKLRYRNTSVIFNFELSKLVVSVKMTQHFCYLLPLHNSKYIKSYNLKQKVNNNNILCQQFYLAFYKIFAIYSSLFTLSSLNCRLTNMDFFGFLIKSTHDLQSQYPANMSSKPERAKYSIFNSSLVLD